MNTRAKGNRIVRKCMQTLESWGCRVAVVERTGKHIKEKDMFGCWDLVSLHEDGGVCFIQCTGKQAHTHKPFLEFSKKFWRTGIVFQQWCWIPYRHFIVHTYRKGLKTREVIL